MQEKQTILRFMLKMQPDRAKLIDCGLAKYAPEESESCNAMRRELFFEALESCIADEGKPKTSQGAVREVPGISVFWRNRN